MIGTLAGADMYLESRTFLGNIPTATANASGVTTWVYVGRATKASTSVTAQYRVTTATTGPCTWGEIALYKGTIATPGTMPTLTRLGTTNVCTPLGTTGLKNTAITATVAVGDDLWFAFGNAQSATVGLLRGTLADDLQGPFVGTSSTQPSAAGGASLAPTASASVVPPWVRIFP